MKHGKREIGSFADTNWGGSPAAAPETRRYAPLPAYIPKVSPTFCVTAVTARFATCDYGHSEACGSGCAKNGIGVIMCTCSRTPPPWLYAAHPEIINTDIQGIRQRPGARVELPCPDPGDQPRRDPQPRHR